MGITRAIEKYGKENFKRDIVSIASYESELNRLEKEWIKLHNAVKNDDDYYNQIPGGNFYRDRNENRKNEKIVEEFLVYAPSIEYYDWELMKESDPNLSDQ